MNPRLVLALLLTGALSLAGIVVGALGMARGGQADRGGGAEASSLGEGVQAAENARFQGALFPDGVRAPDFDLRDEHGRPVRMRDFRGRPVIVTFLYTRCDESCPPQAQQIKGALDELGHEVPAIAVSVDPARDTPASARHFLREQGMTGRLRFALGPKARLRPVWRGFAIQPQEPGAEHQAHIILVDRRGRQRIGFPLQQATPQRIAHDVRELEREA